MYLDAVVCLGPAGLSLEAGVSPHLDAGNQVLRLGPHYLFVGEGCQADPPINDLGGQAVLHAELALQAAGGPGVDQRPGRIEVHQHVDAVHVAGGECLAAQELGGGVQGQVSAAAAGILLDLDARLHHEAPAAQRLRRPVRVVVAATRKGAHETKPALQRVAGCGEPGLHQLGGVNAGAASGAGVVGLGHGAEVLSQPGSLGRRQRDGHGRLHRIQRQQARRRGGRTQRPQRAGGMPAQIVEVRGRDGVANGAGHLESHQVGKQQVAAVGAHFLGQRERAGNQVRAGVGLGDVRHVVIVQGVGHGPIDQCGLQ